ncbi:hypothetical protein IKX12_01220 [Candidatus Saccharibacteria bacterium]|nr:hypothetical protein [Candidatus Saccharibacteria bacterium]
MKKASRSYSENFEFHDYKKEKKDTWFCFFVSCVASLGSSIGLGILLDGVRESDGLVYWALYAGEIGFAIIAGICLISAMAYGIGLRKPSDIIDLLKTNREPR